MNETEVLQAMATDKFSQGYNCAQSVLFAMAPKLNISADQALRMATGFGAGMGRKQEVCGAVSGGVLALSLSHGRSENEPKDRTELTYRLTREMISAFEMRHGSCVCHTLLNGCVLNSPEGQALFKEKNLINEICKPCVRTVIELVYTQLNKPIDAA